MADKSDKPTPAAPSEDAELAALRLAAANDDEIPEAVRGFLAGGAPLDALRLTALGRWTYNGRPVEHPRVVALFGRSLAQTSAGTWVLRVPPYTYPVIVDGAGQFIDRVRVATAQDEPLLKGQTVGRTLGDTWVPLDLQTLETDGDVYLGLRLDGVRARLIGAAYNDVVSGLDADERGWVVRWDDVNYRVASMASDSVSSGIS